MFSLILHHTFGDESFHCHFAGEKAEVKITLWGSGRADTPTCISWAGAHVLSTWNLTPPPSWWARRQQYPISSALLVEFSRAARYFHSQNRPGSCPLGDSPSPPLCDRASCRRHSQPLPIKGNPEKTASGIYCAFSLSQSLAINNTWKDISSCQGGLQRGWGNNAGTLHLAAVSSAHSRREFTESGMKGMPASPAADSWELCVCMNRREEQLVSL